LNKFDLKTHLPYNSLKFAEINEIKMDKRERIIKKITQFLKRHFLENILSVLLYESAVHSKENVDLDVLVILKKKNNPPNDLVLLKKLRRQIKEENLDLQLCYEEEVDNPKLFSLDIHGSFFIEILKKAIPLIGKNPFLNLSVEIEDKQISVVKRVQNYIFRARQEFIGIGRYTKDKNPFYHQKKILRIIDDLLIFDDNFENHSSSFDKFLEKYPGLLSQKEIACLKKKTSVNLENYLPIYEKIYSLILKRSKNHFPCFRVKPLRLKIDKMVVEYINPMASKAIIILDGIPSVPQGERLMNIFASQGYCSFFPRYTGTWESEGEFLDKNPVSEIENLIKKIISGITLGNKTFVSKNIVILGSSFGGAIALSISSLPEIKRVIALSPVIDFTQVPGLETLSPFLKKFYPGAYRYSLRNWKKLINGELISPKKNLGKIRNPERYLILGGAKDEEIKKDELIKIGKEFRILVRIYNDLGHISLSKIQGKVLDDILEFLK
jgi:esterase/lipase